MPDIDRSPSTAGPSPWIDTRNVPRAAVWRIVLIYALFAGLWTIISDRLLVRAVSDPETIGRWATAKGWFFVLITSGVLYSLLRLDRAHLKRTMQALHENNQQLRWLEDNIPGCYMYQYVHGANGRATFLHISAGVEALHQLTRAEVLRDAGCLNRQVGPEQLATLKAAEEESLRTMTDFAQELRILRPDGGRRWLYIRSRPSRRPDGQVVWDGVATDVTAQRRSAEALRESEEWLRSLVRFMPDALFINQDNRVVFVNAPALRLWGGGAGGAGAGPLAVRFLPSRGPCADAAKDQSNVAGGRLRAAGGTQHRETRRHRGAGGDHRDDVYLRRPPGDPGHGP